LSLTCGCSQGKKKHLEGDVARHTAKVVATLVRISSEDQEANFDVIDLLAALMHDVEKPSTRVESEDGAVRFPGHEEKAADRVSDISERLGLSADQREKLDFLVREHGNTYSLPSLAPIDQQRLTQSDYWRNLRLLHKADAMSGYFNLDGSLHETVCWELFEALRAERA
jgi:hypothetical protein